MFESYLKKLIIFLLVIATTAAALSAWLMGEFLGLFLYALPILLSFFKIPRFRFKLSAILFFLVGYSFFLSFFIGNFIGMLIVIHYLSLLAMRELVLMGEYG